MSRRSDHTRAELTKLILDSAFNMVEKSGYTQLSTRKIASEIGYTVGTLYNVFLNLEDIFINVNGRILEIMNARLKKVCQESKSDKEAIYNLSIEYLEFCKTNYNLWNLLFEYRFTENAQIPQWYHNKIKELFDIVEQPVSKLVKNPAYNSHVITSLIWSSIHGICTLYAKGKLKKIGTNDATVLVKQYLDIFLQSI